MAGNQQERRILRGGRPSREEEHASEERSARQAPPHSSLQPSSVVVAQPDLEAPWQDRASEEQVARSATRKQRQSWIALLEADRLERVEQVGGEAHPILRQQVSQPEVEVVVLRQLRARLHVREAAPNVMPV